MRSTRSAFAAIALALLTLPAVAHAQTEIAWADSELLSGSVIDGEVLLDIGEAGVYPLVVIDEPRVAPPRFQLDGTVRYEDVAGVAYLEMWVVLEDNSRYFSRTLAKKGLSGYLTGSSESRPFSLPFELGDDGPSPASLELNVVTEGSGRVWVGPITIVPSATGATDPATTVEASTVEVTTTTLDIASPTSATLAAPVPEPDSTNGWWWLLPVFALGGLVAVIGRRRQTGRRVEEQRRMDLIDSTRS